MLGAVGHISAPNSLIGREDLVKQFGPHLRAAPEAISMAPECPANTDQPPRSSHMSTATLDTLDTAVIVARCGDARRTAADVYAEVAHAWW